MGTSERRFRRVFRQLQECKCRCAGLDAVADASFTPKGWFSLATESESES